MSLNGVVGSLIRTHFPANSRHYFSRNCAVSRSILRKSFVSKDIIRPFSTSPKTLLLQATSKRQAHKLARDSLGRQNQQKRDNLSAVMYATSAGIVMIGVAYASVPLYKVFCQATGLGGEVKRGHDTEQVATMRKIEDTVLEIHFNADTHSSMIFSSSALSTSLLRLFSSSCDL